MKLQRNDRVCILKTGRLYEHDMAVVALKKQGIPFYNETESSSGLSLAMPLQPSMGPGTFYSVLVPSCFVETAKQTLEDLPFEVTTTPDAWDFVPNEKIKRLWKGSIWIYLIIGLLLWIPSIIEIIKIIASAL
jgi:hypothetical protein